MSIVAIPGFDVKKIGKDKYSIAVTNGNMGAAVVNKEQLKHIADIYGVPVKDNSKSKKVAVGIASGLLAAGAIVAGVVYRKNIGKFFNGLKDSKLGEMAKSVGEKAAEGFNSLKNTASNGANVIKEKGIKWYNKAVDFVKRTSKTTKEFFVNGWGNLTDNFKKSV